MAQYRKDTQQYLGDSKTIFEVVMLGTQSGNVVNTTNRLPVDIGNSTINISGNVNISTPNTVTVNSTPEDPVHVHTVEIGNNIVLNNYVPIGGNVVVTSGNLSIYSGNIVVTSGNVTIDNGPASQSVILFHSNASTITNTRPLPVSGNVNVSIVSGSNPSGTSIDAFGRARVSQPITLFDSFHRFEDNGKFATSNTTTTTTTTITTTATTATAATTTKTKTTLTSVS